MLRVKCLMALAVVVSLFASLAASSADAQQGASIERIYGRGVHAYFDGQLSEAMSLFDQAASMGTQDPRVFYFRGLTYSMMGDEYSAKADYDRAADLEMNSGSGSFNVNRSLQRIQGPTRMQIENSRNTAGFANRKMNSNEGTASSIPVIREERVMRPTNVDPSPRIQKTPEQVNFPDVSDVEEPTDLFSGEGETVEVPAEAFEPEVASEPMVETTTNNEQESSTSEVASEPKDDGDADPFGGESEEMPAKEDDGDADPFGGETEEAPVKEEEADADPFGGESEEMPAKEDDGDADPFGGETEEMPAKEDDSDADPFGGDEDESDADPFGDG